MSQFECVRCGKGENECWCKRAQPQAPAPSLDARGDLSEQEIVELDERVAGAKATGWGNAWRWAERLLAEVKRRRAAPSAPSDALRDSLEQIAACCDSREAKGHDPMQAEYCDSDEHKIARAALAASPSVTREQEWRSPECNYQLREILTLAWDHVNPIAAQFRKDILAAREHFAPLPAPTAPKEPQR